MENLKAMIKQMKVRTNSTVSAINNKQCEIVKLIDDMKKLTDESIALSKEYEEMATAMMNMADDLRSQAEDAKEWVMYDLSLEEEDEEDDIFDDEEEDEEDEYDTCDGCGGLVEYDRIIFDDNGNGFCCQECLEEYNVLKDIDDEEEKELSLFN